MEGHPCLGDAAEECISLLYDQVGGVASNILLKEQILGAFRTAIWNADKEQTNKIGGLRHG